MDALEREHPKLIVERDGNILGAFREGSAALAYSFRNDAAFVDHFPSMFEALLPRLKRELRADTVRFRLAYSPAKPAVDPVLRRLSFVPQKPWMGFVVKRGSLAKTAGARGVTFRVGGIDDLDDVVQLDRECFPDSPMPKLLIERMIREDRLLFATVGKAIAGMAIYSLDDGRAYLPILAVREAHRGRGIGAALTTRARRCCSRKARLRWGCERTRTIPTRSDCTDRSDSRSTAPAATMSVRPSSV